MKNVKKLINYIENKYNNLETEKIGGKNNIRRYTKPIMSGYVENAIAILINEVLKNQKLNYLIDSQLSIGKRQPLRPDIIIYDNNNEIKGIVEVKSQLGYSGNFNSDDYNERIKNIKIAAEKGVLSLKKENINFKVSKKCIDLIVILMATNEHNNLEKYEKSNHYLLFKSHNKDIWYDKLSMDTVNHEEGGFDDFIKCIKNME